MNCIVTGATGFIGSHLIRSLKPGNQICAVVRSTSAIAEIQSYVDEFIIYDGSYQSLESKFRKFGADTVVHLATQYVSEHTVVDIDSLMHSNILFGTHVLEAMKSCKTNNLINVGTAWQNFESDVYRPANFYAATKQAFESMAMYYSDACGFRVINLRLFDTYGENDERGKLFTVLRALGEGKIEYLKMSDGLQSSHFVHVDDVVTAIQTAINLLNVAASGVFHIYGIDSSNATSIKDVVSLFASESGKKLDVRWGERPNRPREVYQPHTGYLRLPGWEPKVDLVTGIRRLLGVIESNPY